MRYLCSVLMGGMFLLAAAAAGVADGPVPPDAGAANPVVVMRTTQGEITLELLPQCAPETVRNFLGLALGEKVFVDPATGDTAQRPYYNGLVFHRVIKGFMLQGGCPLGSGAGGPGYSFADEINADSLGLNRLRVEQYPPCFEEAQTQVLRRLNIRSQEELNQRQAEVQAELAKVAALSVKELYELQGYRYRPDLPSLPVRRGCLAMANAGPNSNGSQFFINQVDTPHLDGKHTVFGRVIAGMDVVDTIAAVPVDGNSKPLTPVTIISIERRAPLP